MSEALLTLHDVDVLLGPARAPSPALRGVRLDLRCGERVALVGANGSGKSTLLRVLLGVQAPSRGRCERAAGVRVGMVFQRPYLLRMSVLHNVALGLWLHGVPWTQARAQALHALQRVGLQAQARLPARALSGGQQQRVALARAWALQPDVWLLDEPTANLDPQASRDLEALVLAFATENPAAPRTLVFSSHHLGQVRRLATRVVYLQGGQVLLDAPVEAFFDPAWLARACPQAHAFVHEVLP